MATENTHFSFTEIHNLFTKARRIFFIGIGGISVSSLATYSVFSGKEVFGYDKVRSKESKKLESIAKIKYYSTPDNVNDMDMVIYSSAIPSSNFEYQNAKKLGIPLISRANFLGYIISRHKNKIGICGMHGKSTTVSMLSKIFSYGTKNPTVFCGAEMIDSQSPFILGKENTCIYEACEYLNSFLSMPSDDVGILNIDYDHPDFFNSVDMIISSFQEYASKAKRIFVNADDPLSCKITHPSIVTYGIKNGTYKAEIVHSSEENEFLVYKNHVLLGRCVLKQFGEHLIYDALCAYAIAYENNISHKVISESLYDFEGSKRRMEFFKKTDTGVDIFEDYAHHPTEIKATISAFKKMGYKNILCVFQAHTYSRTYHLYEQFKDAFKECNSLVVLPIFSAREENIYNLTDQGFASDCGGILIEDFCGASKIIKEFKGDLCLIMGAGDIYKLKNLL